MAQNELENTCEPLLALHRYWLNANLLKIYCERSATESLGDWDSSQTHALRTITFFLSPPATFMGLWYAALYIVVEGYRELQLSDPDIDRLLASEHVNALRLFRNGMFHYQKEWYSGKLDQIHQAAEHVEWIRSLHSKLGRFLLDQVKQSIPEERWVEMEKAMNARLSING